VMPSPSRWAFARARRSGKDVNVSSHRFVGTSLRVIRIQQRSFS
jgi:hypothetical protein